MLILLKNILGLSPVGLNRRSVTGKMSTQQSIQRKKNRRNERMKKRQANKRKKRIQQHAFTNKTTTKIWTWNLQKTSLAANNRGRLRRILEYVWINKVDILLITEITSRNDGIFG